MCVRVSVLLSPRPPSSSPPPPPHTHRENMDAELFLGEEEEEVEESPLPTKSTDCYRSRLQSRQGQNTQMGCRPLVVPSLPRVLGAYATYMGLRYSIPCMCQPGLQGLGGRGCGPLSAPNSVCLCSYLCVASIQEWSLLNSVVWVKPFVNVRALR